MTELILSEIFVYPIKSAAGISINEAKIQEKGIEHDRRWMLVDDKGRFISQRSHPELALVSVNIEKDGLIVKYKTKNFDDLFIPFCIDDEFKTEVEIWDDKCAAVPVSNAADCWFSRVLNVPCSLVYMPDNTVRNVDPKYAGENKTVGFADGYPFLLIGQTSLDDLNLRLRKPVSINRFRPNLVFTGGEPFAEDNWKEFKINKIGFFPVKPCARCIVTTVDQETGERGNEPLATLFSYRKINNKVLFGRNMVHEGIGKIAVGDRLVVIK